MPSENAGTDQVQSMGDPANARGGRMYRLAPREDVPSNSSSSDAEIASINKQAAWIDPSTGLDVTLSLHVCRTSADGITRVTRLPLAAIAGVGDLRGLFRRLILGAFPEHLPDYLTSPEFYQFAPSEDFVSLPGDPTCIRFRLVASVGGWEATVAERELGGQPDPERRLLVTMAEFDSEPVALEDGRQMVVSLVAYPTVSVRREFLDDALMRVAAESAFMASSPDDVSGCTAAEEGDSAGSTLTTAL